MALPPIACSLSAAEYRERLAAISKVGGSSLINVEERPRHTVLHFRYSAKTRDELQTIVAQEATCCAFLDLSGGPPTRNSSSESPRRRRHGRSWTTLFGAFGAETETPGLLR
jgi:hypothetical protein